MTKKKYEAFIGYYGDNYVSPVRQDISIIQNHYSRRDYLYRSLGLAPNAFTDKDIIEFGFGSGHNALYITKLNPKSYTLVDYNTRGIEDAKALLGEHFPAYQHDFARSKIQEFSTDKLFDIVLCEGVIPHQDKPVEFTKYIGKFLKPGGILVITTADYVGFVAEVLRRVIRDTLIDSDAPLTKQLEVLCPIFESHYKTLKGASRPLEDWITDNLLHPWVNPLFPIDLAVSGLAPEYEVYGSSPQFFSDWRFYKDLVNSEIANLNSNFILQYYENGISLLDWRSEAIKAPADVYAKIQKLSEQLYWDMVKIETEKTNDFKNASLICSEIAEVMKHIDLRTADSLSEVSNYLKDPKTQNVITAFDKFKSFFGRAQQYVSFVKKIIY
jgi:2-polyprenyl-3-methyl-5-hydroxy-6-metoxy-1,4-benzoquinol methylase